MDRRRFTVTLALGILGTPSGANAQQRESVQRIGFLEFRTAENIFERLPALAGELTRLNVRLIVAPSNAEVAAVKVVSGTIPIVSIFMSDPIGSEFIASYAQPRGNVTGLADRVFAEMARERVDAVSVLSGGILSTHREC